MKTKPKTKSKRKARVGQSMDDFLKEDGSYQDVHAVAIKRVIAWQLAQAMQLQGMTKTEMAKRMHTSRSQLNRLLNPEIERVELQTLARAAQVLGRSLRLELV